jgi:hypothetical protein
MKKETETIHGYKGFDKDLKCRGFQYETGKEYSTDKAVACNTGFHYCENPMDVLGFYPPCDGSGNPNRFCEVEGSGDFDKSKSDKLCCTHLKVKAEIGLNGLIKAGVQFILSRVKWKDDKDTNTGDRSAATNTGNMSAASVDGKDSVAIVTGKDSKAKGALGCWIVLTERDSWNGKTYPIKEVKAFKVDGETIKSNTWYKLVDGEPIEVKED